MKPRSDGDVRTVAKGGAVQAIGQVVARGLAFLFIAIAVRVVGTGDYGLYRQVAQILLIAGLIATGGFNVAAVRFITQARTREDWSSARAAGRQSLFGAAVTSAIVLLGVLVAVEPLSAAFVDADNQTEAALLLRIGAVSIPFFALMQVLRFSTHANKTLLPSVMVFNVIQPSARFALAIVTLIAGLGLIGLISSFVASAVVGTAAAAWYYRDMWGPEERAARPAGRAGPLIRFSLVMAGNNLLSIQTLGLGILILGLARGDRAVGLFGIALSLQGLGSFLLMAIFNITAPVITDLYERNERERLQTLYQTVTRWSAACSFPIYAALMFQADLFTSVLSGQSVRAAATATAILALGNLFYTGTGPVNQLLSMAGRAGINLVDSVIVVVAYVGIGLWASARYGLLGMAVADAVITALANSARVVQARLLVGVNPFGRSFVKPVIATGAFVTTLVAGRWIAPSGRPFEAALLAVALAIYLTVLLKLGLDPEDRDLLKRFRGRFARS